MVRNRDRDNSWLLGDSGGFQIGKGVWEGDWKNPACPKAQKKREQVLTWMDAFMDYGMILDIPAWVCRSPAGRDATGITSYEDAVQGTYINNDWFIHHRNGNCKFLNVLQGENHTEAHDWYKRMKHYCDPNQFPETHFNGWAMGGQNMCDIHLVLHRIVEIIHDGLLEEGIHDFMHFLGTSRLEWAVMLTDIQRAVRKYHNPKFTITFDCASPFLASANGQIYTQYEIDDRSKWVYRMVPGIDDRKYHADTRNFRQAMLQDGFFSRFDDSPITAGLKINDICFYAPGQINKVGKMSVTSWDGFAYAMQMCHNVWAHVNAVQEANRRYDTGIIPNMLVKENFNRILFRDLVDEIFSCKDRDTSIKTIEKYSKFWMQIIGTRGTVGKRTINSSTNYSLFFEEVDQSEETDFSEDQEHNLEILENEENI